MARDRQRAKQRQRQRQQRAGQSGGRQRDRQADGARDSQDEARARDPQVTPHDPEVTPGTNPRADNLSAPPDPLGDAAPDVDIAELAEEGIQEPGAPTDRPLGEKDYPHADELVEADATEEELEEAEEELEEELEAEEREAERDVAEAAVGRPARRRRADAGEALPKGENRLLAFLKASWAELQRVQWPNRKQVAQATAVTIVFVVIAGGYLGIADAVFSRLVEAIL